MKIKQYSILIAVMIVFFGCSHYEDEIVISPQSISFVHADGSKIAENECISPNVKYGIKIETNYVDVNRPFRVDYSVNGVVYTMTFTVNTSQINPITLTNGDNSAQIIGSNYKAVIKYVEQGDFELVE
ncbi:hypothetical protein IRZ71_21805 [Flavobacterium sp. ANB]|uniref:hypothetical protein n=1 Tax=unclassified Flavobacterium TaxID=196869 RepID=UPI0012BA3092|nr:MULTISPECIES: hypothetical protein [unclassified Flavobacterium]MBF4518999.1 hypothetical protein [Flavobacterium sp. ANB]MTD71601.1 hypothetical protein [Flavobacterium sp. LC2016-13]